MPNPYRLLLVLLAITLTLSCNTSDQTLDLRTSGPSGDCSQYRSCVAGGTLENVNGTCTATGADQVNLPCTNSGTTNLQSVRLQATSSSTFHCSTAADCTIYASCVTGGSFMCSSGSCIIVKPDTAYIPCWNQIDPTITSPTVTIASSGNTTTTCGGWQPSGGAGCFNSTFSAPKVGPWISCSSQKAGATVIIKQMRTYVKPQNSPEYLLNTSNFTNNMNYWEALFTWTAFSQGIDGLKVPLSSTGQTYTFSIPSKFTTDSTNISYTTDIKNVVYHAGSLLPSPKGGNQTTHIDLPSGMVSVRVEADVILGDTVTCQVGADPYTAGDTQVPANNRIGEAASSWVGSSCGSSMTISSMDSSGNCSAYATSTPVTTPTTETCQISWNGQPSNLTVGSGFTACFNVASACGSSFRVDLMSSSGVVTTTVLTGSVGLTQSDATRCFNFTAYGDILGNGFYFKAATMDGSPSSGSAVSNGFNISQAAVVTPPPANTWTYTWTLPSTQQLAEIDLRDVNYRVISRLTGTFNSGSVVSLTSASKLNPFAMSGCPVAPCTADGSNSTDVLWSSGYTDASNPQGTCKTNGTISVQSSGSTYYVGAIYYNVVVSTCRNTVN